MKDQYTRQWIIENAQEILLKYSEGITIRELHYQLVNRGMINTLVYYKRVVGAMTKARWDGTISMDSFVDWERSVLGETRYEEKNVDNEIQEGKKQVNAWMTAYYLNRWSNQENYIEVGIEKKALLGVFEKPCRLNDVALSAYKGYSSITFLYEAIPRFQGAISQGKTPIILYFGDYDPSGLDIPRSIHDNLLRLGVDVEIKHIALNPDQIQEMNLPGVPVKSGDSRSNNWEGGEVVECDAIEPHTLSKMCRDAINEYFDKDLYKELQARESNERVIYREALRDYVEELGTK